MDDPKLNSKSVAATPGQRKRADELVALAKAEFGELLGGDEVVVRSAVSGGVASFSNPHTSWNWNDLSNGVEPWGKWDSRGDVRGSLIHWMCTNIEAQRSISNVGI